MELTAKPMDKRSKTQIKALYRTAFPKEEQLPWFFLRLLTLRKCVALTGYYDNDDFCGFTCTVSGSHHIYLWFLAVCQHKHSQGYGSAILSYLKQQAAGKQLILSVEPLDDSVPNADQRIRRARFYNKNGIFDINHTIQEVGGTFRVYSDRAPLDIDSCQKMFRHMSFGFWSPPINPSVPEDSQ